MSPIIALHTPYRSEKKGSCYRCDLFAKGKLGLDLLRMCAKLCLQMLYRKMSCGGLEFEWRIGITSMIEVTKRLAIPEHELTFIASRSSGPGGQHVNKVSSRMTLLFDVAASPSLSDQQKRRLLTRLATRISKDGVLRVVSQKHRSQMANRNAAIERFAALLRDALAPIPVRKKTAVSPAAKQRRLEEKKRRSRLKQQRGQKVEWGE